MLWDTFVSEAKNSSFLFYRNFMEYHKDRFEDHSLLLFKKNKLVALFPANKKDATIYSHQGLTFGGFILPKGIGANEVDELLEVVMKYYTENSMETIQIKTIPQLYHTEAANELSYFLIKNGAKLVDKNLVMAIDYAKPLCIHKTKKKHFKKNKTLGFELEETSNFTAFWNEILIPKLQEKYQSNPVHSLAEIIKLQQNFPDNIKQYNLCRNGEILAGITIFMHEQVVKSQYGATTEKGEKMRALEYLFMLLIEKFKAEGKQYFSMGTVDANTEKGYNVGLLKQKEELGCTAYTQDIYKLPLV